MIAGAAVLAVVPLAEVTVRAVHAGLVADTTADLLDLRGGRREGKLDAIVRIG